MKDHYFLFLNGETENFPKITDFLPNTIRNEKNEKMYFFEHFL